MTFDSSDSDGHDAMGFTTGSELYSAYGTGSEGWRCE